MKKLLCIHGSWYGGWCWEKLKAELLSLGVDCLTPDLPGHGSDLTPLESITFDTYLNALIPLLDLHSTPIAVVGHSFGALIAQSLAELRPTKISKLIFVAGNIAPPGASLMDIVVQDPNSLLGPSARQTDHFVSRIKLEAATPALFNCCTEEIAKWAVQRLCPEPVAPWSHKVNYGSALYAKIPKYYIECTKDFAVTPFQQKTLREGAPCDFVNYLEADHSPFLSTPKELASLLDSILN